ncbi:MAG: hypothetical protein AAFO15_01970 [Pseudomonadota bacterium]
MNENYNPNDTNEGIIQDPKISEENHTFDIDIYQYPQAANKILDTIYYKAIKKSNKIYINAEKINDQILSNPICKLFLMFKNNN